ncbi:OLC1v1033711C2 [Oldenlandia corymbosa var. corymbosa]|uniref:OLC1v1033711C2 n=1 Tax=Oldenlandia corymbosa var. corymbosa TaxID=529605 RepID=A0AAV1CS21_OLDCO|nr:OLC1v1033711C2 [Oldenlandia corymbosa var. corymbosa]
MQASVQSRHQDRSRGMVMNSEVDGDLPMFLEIRKRGKESSNGFVHLHKMPDGFDDSPAPNPDCLEISDLTQLIMNPADNFLDAESQKSDHDWLLTPPRTPSMPLMEISDPNGGNQITNSSAVPTAQISKLENPLDVPSSVNDTSAVQPINSITDGSSVSTNRKPSSARQKSTASRSATPTARSTVPTASRPSRSSTPTSRGTAASSKPAASSARSSTPTRINARSATPPARPLLPSTSSNKSASRSSTPTLRSSNSSSGTTTSSAPSARSSSLIKTVPAMSRNTGGPRIGIVPIVKSRPKASSEAAPVTSSDAPSNLKAMPKRATSASRGRSTAYNSLFSSSNTTTAKQRQKSCSPARGRIKDGALDAGKTVLSRSRGYSNGSDDVNPVLMGTQMVERVVNMRKLAPPKYDNDYSHDNSSGKSSSQDNSGFGRSLSKKSLEMAIRHMDIRRSISGNLKTIVTSGSASSSSSSRRAGSSKTSTTTSASDSPLATCSNTSSEPSVHNISHVLDMNDMDIYDLPN